MMADKERFSCGVSVIHEESVNKVKAQMPPEKTLDDAASFFKVMGDGTRFRLLWALDRQELCVCDLAALLNMSKSAVSHQLRRLRENKLVTFRREGKMVYYQIADDHVHLMLKGCMDHATEEQAEGSGL